MITPADQRGDGGGRAAVDQSAHEVAAAGEQDHGHERERDPEGEDGLGDDQRARRIEAEGEHDEGGQHGQPAAQEQRDPPADEALHDDLTGVGADARARQA